MGHRKRTEKLLLVVAAAGLTACEEDDGHINPPSPPLVCDEVAGGEQLWAKVEIREDSPGLLDIQLHTQDSWSGKPAVTAISGITIGTVHDPGYFTGVVVNAALEVGATTAQFEVRGKVTDGATTCDVHRTFTVTIDESGGVEVTRRDELPFLPYRHASLDPRRHASLDVMQCNGGEGELCAPGGDSQHVARTNAAGTIEATAGGARGDVGRRGRASTRPRG
ncbi:hypothetical protein [Sorangium sp. So ce1099]|uniref:hypothetical protein n=1 Tax=Sorangium sp. So ce1099 TaxID=3133331 RepID=UPI003F6317E1